MGVVGSYVVVGEFFEYAIKLFSYGRFGFFLGGIGVYVILV